MRVFLDENIDRRLAPLLVGHVVDSIWSKGWAGLQNGELIRAIEQEYDVLVTHDRGFQHQQNWEALDIACVILATRRKGTIRERDSVARIIEAIETAPKGAVTVLNL